MQKQIVEHSTSVFEKKMNRLLSEGWKVVPNTTSVSTSSTYNELYGRTDTSTICTATVEKDEEFDPKA